MFVDPATGHTHNLWSALVVLVAICGFFAAILSLAKPKSPHHRIHSVFILTFVALLIQTVVLWPASRFAEGLLNMLAAVVFPLIVYCVIGGLIAFAVAIAQAKAAKIQRPNHWRRVVYISLALSLLGAWGFNSQLASQAAPQKAGSQAATPKDSGTTPTKAKSQPSAQEQVRFKAIMLGVMTDPSYMTPQVRAEFWALLDKEKVSSRDEQHLKNIVPLSNLYVRSFWRDALSSFKAGHPIKSAERKIYESRLTETVSPKAAARRIIKDNETMIKIAAHKPVVMKGSSIVLDQDIIQSVLDEVDAAFARLNKLCTRP